MTTSSVPKPQGNYRPAVRHGDVIYTSGMTPRRDGQLIQTGQVRADAPLADYQAAVELACANALTAARTQLAAGEQVGQVLNMMVMIAAEAGFQAHAKLADFASAYLQATLGDAGVGTRAAVGMGTLPGDSPVEIQLVVAVAPAA